MNNVKGGKEMTDEEKDGLYESICNDINCGTFELAIQFVDKLLAEGRKEKCLEQNKDGTIRPCEVMKENAELKAQIEKMKNCQNCKNRYPETKADYIFCAECPKLDETKDNIILTKWELAE